MLTRTTGGRLAGVALSHSSFHHPEEHPLQGKLAYPWVGVTDLGGTDLKTAVFSG